MKHASFRIIFVALLTTVFISCRKGDKGEPGPAGASANTPAYKSGSITGTLEGTTRTNDSSFSLNLNYQYYKSTADNTYNIVNGEGTYYDYIITRYDSTGNSYIKFEFSMYYYDNSQLRTTQLIPEIFSPRVTIVTNKKLSTNNMFYFGTTTDYYNPFNTSSISLADYSSGGNSNITFDNLVVDSNTGLISFDYSLELGYNDNSTGNIATMNGTVNVNPYNVVYRQGAE